MFTLYLMYSLKTVLITPHCQMLCIQIGCDMYVLFTFGYHPIPIPILNPIPITQLNWTSRGIELCPLLSSMIDQEVSHIWAELWPQK